MTLILGIARIFPTWTRTRRIALGITALCFVCLLTGLTSTILLCKVPGRPVREITWRDCKAAAGTGIPLNIVIEGVRKSTIFYRPQIPRN